MKALIYNTLKLFFRRKSLIFWTFIFPLALATLFSIALKPAYADQLFDRSIDVAIVNKNSDVSQYKAFVTLLDELEINDIKAVDYALKDYDDSLLLLEDESITGIFIVEDNITLDLKHSNRETLVLEQVANTYNQQSKLFEKALKQKGLEAALNVFQTEFNTQFETMTLENNNQMSLQFYTVFGMSAFYSAYWGLQTTLDSEGNLSPVGARKMIAPTKKYRVLLADYFVCFTISFFSQVLLFFYMYYLLGMEVGTYGLWMLTLIAAACLAGISLGKVIGVALKSSEDAKMGILTAFPLIGSALSGLMSIDIKNALDTFAPIINTLNPTAWLIDGMYSLYVYGLSEKFFGNLFSLISFALILFIISLVLGRRKQYESL